ncbi:MAG: hypothetical protein QXT13_02185 [Pyrobaculum sp.]
MVGGIRSILVVVATLAVAVYAGSVAGWFYEVKIVSDVPHMNGTFKYLIDYSYKCVVSNSTGLYEVGAVDECPLGAEYTEEMALQKVPPRYRTDLRNFYVVGFKLKDYYMTEPSFENIRYSFKFVKDYYYFESLGQYVMSEVFSKAWGTLPRSSAEYCQTTAPLAELVKDVVAYMYNTWGVRVGNNEVLYIYLLGSLKCIDYDVGGYSGVVTVAAPYGTVTVGAVVIYDTTGTSYIDIYRPTHLIGRLLGLRPVKGDVPSYTLMGDYVYVGGLYWPDGNWRYVAVPFNILSYQKKLLGWGGSAVVIPLQSISGYTRVTINSPTRYATATHILVTTASNRGYLIEMSYVPYKSWWIYFYEGVYTYFVDNSSGVIMPIIPTEIQYGYSIYSDRFDVDRLDVYLQRTRLTLDKLYICQSISSYNVGARSAAIDTAGGMVVSAAFRITYPLAWPYSYVDTAIISGTNLLWARLGYCHFSLGGPVVNDVVGLFNPVGKVGYGGLPFYYDPNAGGIRDARSGAVYTGSNVFLVAALNVTNAFGWSGPPRVVVIAWGIGGDGTYASAVWLATRYYEGRDKYAVVVRWTDANGNGLPDALDRYEVLATWP